LEFDVINIWECLALTFVMVNPFYNRHQRHKFRRSGFGYSTKLNSLYGGYQGFFACDLKGF